MARQETLTSELPTKANDRRRAASPLLVTAAVLGAIALLALLSLLRQDGIQAWRSMWAEDGTVFFRGDARSGVGSLAETYSGYLVTVPRLVAFAAAIIPIREVSAFYAVAAAGFTALCAVACFWLSDHLVRSPVLRGVLAASFVLHPVVAYEVLNNATNVIWPLTFLCFLALLRPPRGTVDTAASAAIGFLAVTSQVLCIVWIPIAALALWRRPRDRRVWVVLGAYGLGVVLQCVAVVSATSDSPRAATDVLDLPKLFVVRVLGTAVLGEKWIGEVWASWGAAAIVVLMVVVVLAVVILEWRSPTSARFDSVLAFGSAFVFFAVAVGIRGTSQMALAAGGWVSGGSRFVFVALELTLLGLFILIDRATMSERVRRIIVAAVVAQLVILAIGAFRYTNSRSSGPVWPDAVAAAQEGCRHLPGGADVSIAISPAPVWSTTVSCAWLRSRS